MLPTKEQVILFGNTPCGSWGMFQVPPTKEQVILFGNTPCGSWGMFQIQPTIEAGLERSPSCRWGYFRKKDLLRSSVG